MKGRSGEAPQGTPMYNHAVSYKVADDRAAALGVLYKNRVKEGPRPKIAKSIIKADSRNGGTARMYNGEPPATREWHAETAGYAQRAMRQTEV